MSGFIATESIPAALEIAVGKGGDRRGVLEEVLRIRPGGAL